MAGPQLISIIPDDGDVLLAGQTRHTAPQELTFRFNEGQVIDPATLGGIQIVRAGPDRTLGTLDDVNIVPGFRGIGGRAGEVVVRFFEPLPDDLYRINIQASGPNALFNDPPGDDLPEAFTNSGPVQVPFDFRLDLGPQVVAVVPQPVTTDGSGNRVQAANQIEVYFNNDDLRSSAGPLDPDYFQLIFTAGTATNADDAVHVPSSVSYDPATDKAVLTFASNLNLLSPTGNGTFRLRIGSAEAPLPAPTSPLVATDPASTFVAAFDGGTLGPQTKIFSTAIEAQALNPGLLFPGGIGEAGHRDIPHEAHLGGGDSSSGATATISYNFPRIYGSVLGVQQENVITEGQKQRAREIFQLYSYYLGAQFVEVTSDALGAASIGVITGDIRALAPSAPPENIGGIAGGGRAIMNALFDWGQSEYGGGWFQTAMHEIGHTLGLGHSYELPPITIQGTSHPNLAAGTSPEPVFPGDHDIVHGQHLFRRDSKDIDLYKFVVNTAGTFTAETVAERRSTTSLLNSALTLYNELNILRVPASGGAGIGDGQRFTINDGTLTKTFEFNSAGTVLPGNVAIPFSTGSNTHDISVAMAAAINGAGLNVTADSQLDRVVLRGPLTDVNTTAAPALTRLIDREVIARNDDYFSKDSFIELALEPGRYYVGVSSTGNTDYNPNVLDSGFGGTSQGAYDLRLNFRPEATDSLTDFVAPLFTGLNRFGGDDATVLDGDADGRPGGIFNFWFDAGNTIFVDKTAAPGGNGSLANPLRELDDALALAANRLVVPSGSRLQDTQTFIVNDGVNPPVTFEFNSVGGVAPGNVQVFFTPSHTAAQVAANLVTAINNALGLNTAAALNASDPAIVDLSNNSFVDVQGTPALLAGIKIVRVLANAGADGNLATPGDAAPYLIGFDPFGNELADGFKAEVPQSVSLVIDAGAVIKLRHANIDAGSSAQNFDRSGGAIQALGTPGRNVVFTSYHDNTAGGVTDSPDEPPVAGQWGGLVFRDDSDLEEQGIFLSAVSQSELRYGGGQVTVNGLTSVYNPVHMETARPAVAHNTIIHSADAAISADPNSFEDTKFTAAALDYDRVGPDIHGNRVAVRQPLVITAASALSLTDGDLFVVNNTVFEINRIGGVTTGNVGVTIADADTPAMVADKIAQAINGAAIGVTATATASQVSLVNAASARVLAPMVLSAPVLDNTTNGLFVRISTLAGQPLNTLDVSARFDDTDIVHVLTENLIIRGTPGGPVGSAARFDARLDIDPGLIVKLQGSRIEVGMGATLIAEGDLGREVIFTSLEDDRFGAGGTYDTGGDGASTPVPGDWGGFYFNPTSRGSVDHAFVTFAGGSTTIEGGFDKFNTFEIRQADVRIANSVLENNADGRAELPASNPTRAGRLGNTAATIYVLGAQPVLVNNVLRNNQGAAIDINANALRSEIVIDYGRSTGGVDDFEQFADNHGPLVRLNRIGNVANVDGPINGMLVRGATLNIESVWDDVDIVHVLLNEIAVPNFHTFGGLRLQSSPTESLVVKLGGANAGFTATGTPLDINDRIGGTVQIIGTPGHPVVLTATTDCTVGAGLTPDGKPQNDTLNGQCGTTSVVGGSGPVFIDGGDRDEHGDFDPDGPDNIAGNADDGNQDGWKFIEQAVNFAYSGSRNAAGTGILVIGTTLGTTSSDAIESAATALGLPPPTYVTGAAITTANFNAFKMIYVPSSQGGTFGGIDDADIALLTARKADVQTFVNNLGGGLVALTETGADTPYAWLELPAPFAIVDYTQGFGNADPLTQTPALAAAGFNISDAELNRGTPWHNSFSGPPGFNNLQPWVVSAVTGEVVTLGLPAGSTGIGGTGSTPGAWRSVRLDKFSNDRNVAAINEAEETFTGGLGSNDTPGTAQVLGELAPDERSGDDNRRLGFEIHGNISLDDPGDADVYTFKARGGTEIWLDIDRTTHSLDTIIELIDVNGTVLARSNDSVNETTASLPGLVPGNLARVMQRDVYLNGLYSSSNRDYNTTNPRDAGMRLILPGQAGSVPNTYYVRVRSNGPSLNNVHGGVSQGAYQLQVRLRELDEVPGSTVRHADIRFAANGIEVLGMPAHSPLLGDTAETTGPHGTLGNAQDLGNLLESDRNTISVGGTLDSPGQVDWYKFTIDYDLIQAVGGFNGGAKTWSTIFDIDYADGLARADTTVSVFDDQGRLILTGRDSDVADDQPRVAGSSTADLERGSFGKRDPFIGAVQMPEGANRTYFVAVHSNRTLPTAINGTFQSAASQAFVRLEPIDGSRRIAEDHVGFQGLQTGQLPSTLQKMFNDSSTLSLNAHATPFNLSDVVLYVAQTGLTGRLFTVNPSTGLVETDIGDLQDSGFGYGDIAMRNDSRLFGFTLGINDANSGNYHQLNPANATILDPPGFGGEDGIVTNQFDNSTPPAVIALNTGIQFNAVAFFETGSSEGGTNRRLFAIGSYGGGNRVPPFDSLLYELDPSTGAVFPDSCGPCVKIPTNPRPASTSTFSTSPIILAPDATDMPDLVDPDISDPGDLEDKQTFRLERGAAQFTFEFDSGPEIRFGTVTESPLGQRDGVLYSMPNANDFRDGMYFWLDGRRFEFNSGPVIVIPGNDTTNRAGNLINDGDFFTLADDTNTPGSTQINTPRTFEFDSNNVLNNPAAIRIAFVSGALGASTQSQVATATATAINGAGLTFGAVVTTNGRVSLTRDTAITPVSPNYNPVIVAADATDQTGNPAVPGNITDGDTFALSRWNIVQTFATNTATWQTTTFEFDTGVEVNFGGAIDARNFRDGQFFMLNGQRFEFDSGPVLVAAAASAYTDGQTFALTDTGGAVFTFEFNDNGTVNTPGATGITFTAGLNDTQMANLIQAAINSVASPLDAAVPAGTTRITISGDTAVVNATPGLGVQGAYGVVSGTAINFEETDSLSAAAVGSLQSKIAAVVDAFVFSGPVTRIDASFAGSRMAFLGTQGGNPAANFAFDFNGLGGNGGAVTTNPAPINEIPGTFNGVTPGNTRISVLMDDTAAQIATKIEAAIDANFAPANSAAVDPSDPSRVIVRNTSGFDAFTPGVTVEGALTLVTTAPLLPSVVVEGEYGINSSSPAGPATRIDFEEFFNLLPPRLVPQANDPVPYQLQTAIADAVNNFFNGSITASFERERMAFLGASGGDFTFDFDGPGGNNGPGGNGGAVTNRPLPAGVIEVAGALNGVAANSIRVPFLLTDSDQVIANSIEDAIDANFSEPNSATLIPPDPSVPGDRWKVRVDNTTRVVINDPLQLAGGGGDGPGGAVTGMAQVGGQMFVVTASGGLYQLNVGPRTGFNPLFPTLDYVDSSGALLGITFSGLAAGPRNLQGGAFANVLFATDTSGRLYAFNTAGILQNVFDSNGDGVPDSSSVATGIFNATGLAFSPLDYNLFHVTKRRGFDEGHGIELPFDNSRTELTDEQYRGDISFYFGLEDRRIINETISIQPGSQNYETNTAIYNTYDFPGGAHGSLTTNTFSLEQYSRTDKPTLYFNYFLATEGRNSDSDDMRDSMRVFVSANGVNWSMLATNNSVLDAELPEYLSTSSNTGSGDARQRVQELFDNTGVWRQARVDLGDFAGLDNLRFRFDFATAGDITPPNVASMPGDQFGDYRDRERAERNNFEGFYLDDIIVGFAERGEMATGATADTGFFNLPVNPEPGDPVDLLTGPYQLEIRRGTEYGANSSGTAPEIFLFGSYDTNDRFSSAFKLVMPAGNQFTNGQTFRLSDGVNQLTFEFRVSGAAAPGNQPIFFSPGNTAAQMAVIIRNAINGVNNPAILDVTATVQNAGTSNRLDLHGNASLDSLGTPWQVIQSEDLGDRNLPREQGQIVLESNRITNSLEFGIKVDAGIRDASGSLTHPGGTRNLSVLNAQRLVPGITIENNLLVGGGQGGIQFRGDANGTDLPLAAVPFGRIINNTIYGKEQRIGRGVEVSRNASPTILNNIFANLVTGVQIDSTSGTTVVGGSIYQNNGANKSGGSAETFAAALSATDALFRDPEIGNFYLAAGSLAIDSSIDNLADRAAMVAVSSPLGIPVSPIIGPEFDLVAQLRVDDPTVAPFPGIGGNVFKDRGALEKADVAGPASELLNPRDNDLEDQNPAPNIVHRLGETIDRFSIQLVDLLGAGIDDSTVLGTNFVVRRNGVLLRSGIDYIFSYDVNNDIAHFTAAAGVWLNGNQYTIALDNGIKFDRLDPSNTPIGIRDLAGNLLRANAPDGFTEYNVILDTTANDAPVISVQGPVPQTVPEEGTLVFSSATGNPITVFDVDAAADEIEISLTTAYGTLTLASTAGLTVTTGDGTDDAAITFRGDLAAINAALEGMSFTAMLDFESPERATIEIEADDLGHNGSGGPQVGSATVFIDVSPLNDAPVLDNSGTPTLASITEDLPLANNTGTTIADMLASGANGDPITDVDDNPLEGIAVIGATGTANGTWQFSLNDGVSWFALGNVLPTSARLLRATDRVRFVPNANFNGTATIEFHAWDRTSGFAGGSANLLVGGTGGDTAFSTATETAGITISAINDAPLVTVPFGPFITDEETPIDFTRPVATITVSDVDANEGDGLVRLTINAPEGTLTLATTDDLSSVIGDGTSSVVLTGSLMAVNEALDGLVFLPAVDFDGVATITFVANDLGNTGAGGLLDSPPATIDVTVNPVQDAPVLDNSGTPSFSPVFEDLAVASNNGSLIADMLATAAGGDPISDVDSGAVEGIAVVGLSGTANGIWQFSVNGGSSWSPMGNVSLASARLLRDSDRVRFLPNLHFNGTVSLSFHAWDQASGTAGGTANLSSVGGTGGATAFSLASETATLEVLPVNDPPSFSLQNHQANEDSGMQEVPGFAFAISPGPLDESGQLPEAFTIVSNSGASLFSVQPVISASGTLTYTPAPNAFGVATIRVRLKDNGGTANGGVDTSFERVATITINGINDAPTLDGIANAALPVNASAQTVNLTGIGAGIGESQQLTITASSSNPGLIPNPTVNYTSPNATGTLQYTPVAGAEGTAIITVTVTDNGGTSNGGINSFSRIFLVGVGSANNMPAAIGGTASTLEDTDVTIALEGTDVENDVLTAVITQLPTAGRLFQTADGFTRGAQITAADTLVTDPGRRVIYVPNANANGTPHDTFSFVVQDAQVSPEADMTVNVTPVNDAPSFVAGPNQRVNVNAGARTVAGWASGISKGAANESGQALTFEVTGNTNTALFAVQPAINPANGNLTFTPVAGMTGTATITVMLRDDGGTGNGGVNSSAAQSFTITVNSAPVATGETYILGQSTAATTIAGEGVLANDTDPDGDVLAAAVLNPPTRGTVVMNANGSFTYTMGVGFQGLDRFTYRAGDGLASSATVTVTVISYEASLVRKLYQQVLARDPEDAGLMFWTGRIMNGEGYGRVAEGIFESDERLNPIIRDFYRDFLLREADLQGLTFWRDQVWKRDGGPENVIAGMIGSPEFFQSAGGNNTGWVTELYRRLLDREPESAGLQFWVDALDSQRLTRQQVVLGFVESDENFRNLVNGWFVQYLSRQPSAGESADLVGRMKNGASHREIQIGLIDSEEYRNTPPPPAVGTARRIIF